MATPKQIDANRRNALRSTGPKTPAGKTISSRNALRHGLRARAARLTRIESHLYHDKDTLADLFSALRKPHYGTQYPPDPSPNEPKLTLERSFYHAPHELERLRAKRALPQDTP